MPAVAVPLLIALVSLLAAPAAVSAQSRPLVRTGGSTVALTVDGETATERVGVSVARGVRAQDLRVRVARAVRGSSRRADYHDAFSVRFVPAGRRPDALELTVRTASLARPGTYVVTLRVSSRRGGRVTPVRLRVVVRPARLRAPAAIRIRHTRGLLWSADELAGAPNLRDVSAYTRIRDLRASIVDGPTQDGRPARGAIVFDGPSLMPRGDGPLTVEVSDLPVGTATGVVELDAPELAQPVPIPFEITSEYPDWLVIVVVIAGLLLGTLLRTVLGGLERRARTRAAHAWLKQRLEGEIAREPDDRLRGGLSQALALLGTGRGLPGSIADATRRASQRRDEAYAAYAADYAAALAEIEQLRTKVNHHSRVIDLDRQFASAREAVESGRDFLDARAVTQAVERADWARGQLVPGVEDQAREWAHAASMLVGTIGVTPATLLLPDRAADSVEISAVIDAVPPVAAAGDDFGATAVKATDTAAALFEVFVRDALKKAQELLILTVLQLDEGSAERAELIGALDEFAAARYDSVDTINALNDRLIALGILVEGIRARFGLTTPTAPVSLQRDQPVRSGTAVAGAMAVVAQATVEPAAPMAPPKPAEEPAAFEAPTVTGYLALFVVGLLRFAILAVVLSLLGYFIFRDGFQGTWPEMINVFVWAFFTDVALSTAETLRSRLPGMPSATPASTTP